MSNVAASAAVGPPPGMRVRLSSNESPFGPSPAAIKAAQAAVQQGHLYPDDQSIELRRALATFEGRAFEEVVVGTGSAALLMDTIGHECRDGGDVVAYERSFVVYRLAARNAGAPYREVATGGAAIGDVDGYQRDPDALLAAVTDATRVVVIDNPGNPTGAHLTGAQVAHVVSELPDHVTIVLDEAYNQFATGQRGYAPVAQLDVDHPRLLVMRTFSKAYALAGLRVGYLQGPADLVASIDQWRTRFNVTAPGQAAAIAALQDQDHLATGVAATLAGRARMAQGLADLGVPFTDGLGNFLTIELGTAAAPVVQAYAAHGIGVRPLAPYGMTEQIRVTVGSPDEVEDFLQASKEVLADLPSRR